MEDQDFIFFTIMVHHNLDMELSIPQFCYCIPHLRYINDNFILQFQFVPNFVFLAACNNGS